MLLVAETAKREMDKGAPSLKHPIYRVFDALCPFAAGDKKGHNADPFNG